MKTPTDCCVSIFHAAPICLCTARPSSAPSQGSSMKGPERPCSIRRLLRSSQNVLQRSVELTAQNGHSRPAIVLIFSADSGGNRAEGQTVQKGRDIRRRDGLAEQIALTFGAAVGLEICQLPGVLDAFGGGGQTKSFCKAEDRADDHLTFLALVETRYKASVNLDLVEMKREQLAQRGVACAEIIERNTYAGLAKLIDHGLRNPDIFNKRALGDFNLQTARAESGLPKDR